MILTSEWLSRHSLVQILQSTTSKKSPKLSVFNDFDFRIVLWPQPGEDFAAHGFKKCSKTLIFFNDLDFRIALLPQPGVDFVEHNFKEYSKNCRFLMISTSESLSRHSLVPILQNTTSKSGPKLPRFK